MNDHTVDLLKECDSGVKTAVNSIKEVLDNINSQSLRELLTDSLTCHESLGNEIHEMLSELGEKGKDPNPMAKSMSWVKTNVKLAMNESDATIADLMTDGCNMGVKSLSQYLNQYQAADEASKDIAKRLIHIEEQLANELRQFL